MRLLLLSTLAVTILQGMSCNSADSRDKEIELEQKRLEVREKEIDLERRKLVQKSVEDQNTTEEEPVQEEPSITKYMYVVVETEEPEITSRFVDEPARKSTQSNSSSSSSYFAEPLTAPSLPSQRYVSTVNDVARRYVSRIRRVDDFSVDLKAEIQDAYTEEIAKTRIRSANTKLELEKTMASSPVDKEARITRVYSGVFETYAEASAAKAALRNN